MPRALSPEEVVRGFELLADPKAWRKEARKTYRKVGTVAAKYARAAMREGDAQLAGSARAVRGTSNTTSASLGVSNRVVPYALAATWGTKGRTGWYAAERFDGGRPNNPPWVGASWTVATAGEGPRGINDALAAHEDELVQLFADQVLDLATRAFGT